MNDNSQSVYRDLLVWQKSMDFANSVIDLTEQLETDRKHYRLVEQLRSNAHIFEEKHWFFSAFWLLQFIIFVKPLPTAVGRVKRFYRDE